MNRELATVEMDEIAQTCFDNLRCAHQWIEEHARRSPDAVAVGSPDGTEITFGELDRRANCLANLLQIFGVAAEKPVALLLGRSWKMIAAMLGVLKAGGVCVPLDPEYPAERLAYMIEDCGATVLVYEEAFREKMPSGEPVQEILLEDCDWDNPVAVVPGSSAARHGGSAAYIIYTSGSTGLPKGVVCTHAGLMNLIRWHQDAYAITPRDRATVVASTGFDASIWEIFPYLAAGASVHWIAGEDRYNPELLARKLFDLGITVCFLPTPLAEAAIRDGVFHGLELRTLLTGGDELGPCSALLPQTIAFVNAYGPTECTVVATTASVPRGDQHPPIGTAIRNTKVYVLNDDLEEVGEGETGQLYIGGTGLARGYFNRPSLSAERFLANPYASVLGERFYRTGDLARRRPDGQLEFAGRADQQVKIRGHRIELGEIEAVLKCCPGVCEAAVAVHGNQDARQLVAYLVAKEDAPTDLGTIRAHAARKLPAYMLPDAAVTLSKLPLTPNGKVDRKELARRTVVSGAPLHTPRNAQEETLCSLFAQVLGRPRCGVQDDFFTHGGNSLLATRLVNRIRSILRIDLPIAVLFQAPTVEALSEYLKSSQSTAEICRRQERPDPLPLSFNQRRLWFLHRLETGSAAYHVPLALRLKGSISIAMLREALGDVIARHESLRTVFDYLNGEPRQVVLSVAQAREKTSIHCEDVSAEGLSWRLSQATEEPFDLESSLPIRAYLFQSKDDEDVVLIVMHHIATDGWSIDVLLEDLALACRARTAGMEPAWAPLPVQYADWTLWQRNSLGSREVPRSPLSRHLEFWRSHLASIPEESVLAMDYPRPSVPSRKGATVIVPLGPGLHRRLRQLSHEHSVSLFMALHAALAVLLSRLGSSKDIVIGAPVAGRSDAGAEALIGFFVNTLVLRLDCSGNPSFAELLQQTREADLAAFTHEIPFDALVDDLNPARSLSKSPLFQIMMVLQSDSRAVHNLGVAEASEIEVADRTSQFDLLFEFREHFSHGLEVDRFDLRIQYATELFAAKTVEPIGAMLARLLEAIPENASLGVMSLPLLSESEKQKLVCEWNATQTDCGRVRNLHRLIEEQVEKTPEAIAVTFENEQLTYAQLNARANQWAHYLRRHGVREESRVGVCLHRSIEMMVGLLAILKAGAMYVPLDPDYPADRLQYMVQDAAAGVLLVDGKTSELLHGMVACLIDVGDGKKAATEPSDCAPPAAVYPGGAAYMIYTSGTTGRPKGVVNTHEGICNRLLWMQETYRLTPSDVVLQKTPFSFDVSVWEFFWPLMVGARLVFAVPEGHKDTAYLARTIQSQGVTTIHYVPSMLAVMLEDRAFANCTGLKRVICSGEALSKTVVNRFYATLPGAELHNLYGPTEAAVDVTSWHCQKNNNSAAVPIGRPIANIQIYVLDEYGNPAPVGVTGQLLIGGIGLARGYHNKPGLTAERFIADSVSEISGARLYRTGDLARWCADGTIEYMGRADHQIKLRGLRIELGEIESVLAAQPGVSNVAVLCRQDDGDRRLVAYLVPAAGETLDTGRLRETLARTLPEYMVPAAFVTLHELPLSPNGKLQRDALPKPDYMTRRRESRPPQTELEKQLCGIYREILGAGEIGVDDNFFELGGHSLLAIRMAAKIGEATGRQIPIRMLFDLPTVATLAAALAELDAGGAAQKQTIVRVSRSQPLPVSYEEELFIRMQDGSLNMPVALRLDGPLNPSLLAQAIDDLAGRYEILRSSFERDNNALWRIVRPSNPVKLEHRDLTAYPDEEREERFTGLAAQASTEPFHIDGGSLYRVILFTISAQEHRLLAVFHHSIFDASSRILWRTALLNRYSALERGGSEPLPPLDVDYADFAVWQRERLSAGFLGPMLNYWRLKLSGAPPLIEIPADRPRKPLATMHGGSHEFTLSASAAAALQALAQQRSGTLFAALLAVFNILVYRLTGENTVIVGTPVSNRGRAELHEIVGVFVNSIPLCTELSRDWSFTELLDKVRENTLEAFTYQETPLLEMTRALRLGADGSHLAMLQILFSTAPPDPFFGKSAQAGSLVASSIRIEEAHASRFDLSLSYCSAGGGELAFTLVYNKELFSPERIARYAGQYLHLIHQVIANPSAKVDDYDLSSADPQHAVPSAPSKKVCAQDTLLARFRKRVKEEPDAIAYAQGQGCKTSFQLDQDSDRIQAALALHGVRPGDVVALFCDFGPRTLEAVLAVLKTRAVVTWLRRQDGEEKLRAKLDCAQPKAILEVKGTVLPPAAEEWVHRNSCSWIRNADCELAKPPAGPYESSASSVDDCVYIAWGRAEEPDKVLAIEVTHERLLQFVDWLAREHSVDQEDRIGVLPDIGEASYLENLFAGLSTGAVLQFAEKREKTAAQQAQWLRDKNITVFIHDSGFWRAIHDSEGLFPALRLAVLQGEKTYRADLDAIRGMAAGSEIVCLHGVQELPHCYTAHTDAGGAQAELPLVLPLGRGIAGMEALLLNHAGKIAAFGELAELCFRTGHRGTRTDSEKEVDRSDMIGYRTGVMGRYAIDGEIDFVGGRGSFSMVRGYRVEHAVVEAVLMQHPKVLAASVSLDAENRLAAHIVQKTEPGSKATQGFQQFLKERIPEYMRPEVFVPTDASYASVRLYAPSSEVN